MRNFKKALQFEMLLKKFNSIHRDLGSIHDPRIPDNDVEHSYRAAMLSWMINEEYELGLDASKILKYALLHDFVEIYAGDTSIYKEYSQKKKEQKEHKALLKLQKQFPKLSSLWDTIEAYENKHDEEAKFVYVIEKLEPIFTLILSGEKYAHKGITLEDFIDRKQKKMKTVDTVAQVFNTETMDYLRKNKKKFF